MVFVGLKGDMDPLPLKHCVLHCFNGRTTVLCIFLYARINLLFIVTNKTLIKVTCYATMLLYYYLV